MKYKLLLLSIFLASLSTVFAQEDEWAWWNELAHWDGETPWQYYYTYSPRYFGPNAFPVPKMGDGKVPEKLIVDAAVEQYWGYGDNATDLNLRIDIPLYPKYVNLAVWMVPVEYYNTSIHVRNERLMRTKVPKGFAVGDVYIQTGIQILRDRPKAPDIIINLCMKTAPGGPLTAARYFDTPAISSMPPSAKLSSLRNPSIFALSLFPAGWASSAGNPSVPTSPCKTMPSSTVYASP